jgi:DNA-binding transcriptional ArsR family regulator
VCPDLAVVGRAIAEPARAAMLLRLMDGQTHTARDLAVAADLGPSAATVHLRRLVDAGFVTVTVVGRQKLHRLASAEVAVAIEALAAIAPDRPARSLKASQAAMHLRVARSCYSHLGGGLAIAMAERLVADDVIDALAPGTVGGLRGFDHPLLSALAVTGLRPGSGPAVRGCLDGTERAPHVAGRLGSTLLDALVEQQWVLRRPNDRALTVTRHGAAELDRAGVQYRPSAQPGVGHVDAFQ